MCILIPDPHPWAEGELFTVELLEREQIDPFDSEEEAIATLQAILNDIKSVTQWHLQVHARPLV